MHDAPHREVDTAPWEAFLAAQGLRWPSALRVTPRQRPASLCFVEDEGRVLLLHRNYPPFINRWAAPGGKHLPGESPDAAARREVLEETGLHVEELTFRMMVAEAGPNDSANWLLFLFTGKAVSGQQRASDEGELGWFERERLTTVGMAPVDLVLQEHIFSSEAPRWAEIAFDTNGRVARLSVNPFT